MTNITEADHDAVDWLYEMGVIAPHHLRLANEAFARHRALIEALEAENERLQGLVSSYRLQIDQLHDRKALGDTYETR